MRNVELLLRESVPNLGKVGDIVRVAPGYARNYLLPRRIGVHATPEAVAAMHRKREEYEALEAARLAEAGQRADALGKVVLETRQKADETGRLYGSVSASVVARLLTEAGYPVDDRDVRLEAPIKDVGEHEVPIHVHAELTGVVTVRVTAAE